MILRLILALCALTLGVACATPANSATSDAPAIGAPALPAASATPAGALAANTDAVVSVATATRLLTSTPLPPTATPSATPTSTPTPTPVLRQLTEGRCCVNPSWRADGQSIRFIDRPTAAMPAGYYEVPLNAPAPVLIGNLVTESLGSWSHGDRFYLIPGADGYTVIDNQTGERYQTESTGNNRPNISPDGTRLAYQISDQSQGVPFNERFASLYTANLDSSDEQLVLEGTGTSFSGWLDNDHWLLSVINPADPEERVLHRYTLAGGERVELARGTRIQGTTISPDGQHIAYYVTLDRQHPERNGYWLTNTATGETRALPFVGAYRWRGADTILVIPFEPGALGFRIQEFNIKTDSLRDLTDPASDPFRIHNNDWSLSPDGDRIVFVNAEDRNLWLIELPK